ncbi:MAG: hypothetical protein PW788_11425 [Micavibrio sp.]|nr:hypothetical protein [Micavibrio sp.]
MAYSTDIYSAAWFRTMNKISPLLSDIVRLNARAVESREQCALCGCGNADSHDLLVRGHLISLSTCGKCYALHSSAFRANMVAASLIAHNVVRDVFSTDAFSSPQTA